MEVEIVDFKSEIVLKQEYYKFFSGNDLKPLNWGLQMTIGLIDTGKINIKKIKL